METVVRAAEAGPVPSMEDAIAAALAMRREMLHALEHEFGPRDWSEAPNSLRFTRAAAPGGSVDGSTHRAADDAADTSTDGAADHSADGCTDGSSAEAEVVGLGTVYVEGTYPEGQWRHAADVVAKVGERHGFTRLIIHSDRPGDLAFRGEGPRGGFYQFGMQTNTILTLGVGAHRWAGKPYRALPDDVE